MGELLIHLDDISEKKARNYAKKINISIDQWIADLIEEKISEVWPESVKRLAGSWSDFPTIEEIRAETGIDIQRDSL